MCPQTPRLSPEYSHKAGLQTVITGRPLQIRPLTRNGHAGPFTMGRIARGPPFWTRSQDETTSSQFFVRWRMRRRVSLPVVLSPLVQRVRRRPRAKGGVFTFAPTEHKRVQLGDLKRKAISQGQGSSSVRPHYSSPQGTLVRTGGGQLRAPRRGVNR
jgi:hypothetical protein